MTDVFDWISYFQGQLAALSAAFLWALASVLYARIGQYLAPLKIVMPSCTKQGCQSKLTRMSKNAGADELKCFRKFGSLV
jgi:hypothetical protein